MKYCFVTAEIVSMCVYATLVLAFHVLGTLLGLTWSTLKWIRRCFS